MSSQTATVKTAPAYNVFTNLFRFWGYGAYGYAYFSCVAGWQPLRITLVSWDGTKVTIAGAITAPCSGTLYEVQFGLYERNNRFGGLGDIGSLNISVSSGQAYTLYLVETLSTPTTGTFQTQ